jgi:hypothetical protein
MSIHLVSFIVEEDEKNEIEQVKHSNIMYIMLLLSKNTN